MTLPRATSVVAVVLVGLSAGFFFAYEASVTRGLAQVDDVTYVTTFQAINDTVTNAWFGLVFFGSVPALGAALVANWRAGRTPRVLTATALGLYLAGVTITGTGNVPLNDDLGEVVDLSSGTAAAARHDFEADWNQLNLARSIAIGASFAAMAAAAAAPTRRVDADG